MGSNDFQLEDQILDFFKYELKHYDDCIENTFFGTNWFVAHHHISLSSYQGEIALEKMMVVAPLFYVVIGDSSYCLCGLMEELQMLVQWLGRKSYLQFEPCFVVVKKSIKRFTYKYVSIKRIKMNLQNTARDCCVFNNYQHTTCTSCPLTMLERNVCTF